MLNTAGKILYLINYHLHYSDAEEEDDELSELYISLFKGEYIFLHAVPIL